MTEAERELKELVTEEGLITHDDCVNGDDNDFEGCSLRRAILRWHEKHSHSPAAVGVSRDRVDVVLKKHGIISYHVAGDRPIQDTPDNVWRFRILDDLMALLSPEKKDHCEHVDKIRMGGSYHWVIRDPNVKDGSIYYMKLDNCTVCGAKLPTEPPNGT